MKFIKLLFFFLFISTILFSNVSAEPIHINEVSIYDLSNFRCWNDSFDQNTLKFKNNNYSITFFEDLRRPFYKGWYSESSNPNVKFKEYGTDRYSRLYGNQNSQLSDNIAYFLEDTNGFIYEIETDGRWLLLTVDVSLDTDNYSFIEEQYNKIKKGVHDLKHNLYIIRKKEGICGISNNNLLNSEPNLKIFNVHGFGSISSVGCIVEDSLIVDCENSDTYTNLKSIDGLWHYHNFEQSVCYKEGQNIICLDKGDIERVETSNLKEDNNLYGTAIIFSESKVKNRLDRSGQIVINEQFDLIRNLEDNLYYFDKLDKARNDLSVDIDTVSSLIKGIDETSNISKLEALREEKENNTMDIGDYRTVLELLDDSSLPFNKNGYKLSLHFYDHYYSDLLGYYSSNYQNNLNRFMIDIGYYQNRLDFFRTYTSQVEQNIRLRESVESGTRNTYYVIGGSFLSIFLLLFLEWCSRYKTHNKNQKSLLQNLLVDLDILNKEEWELKISGKTIKIKGHISWIKKEIKKRQPKVHSIKVLDSNFYASSLDSEIKGVETYKIKRLLSLASDKISIINSYISSGNVKKLNKNTVIDDLTVIIGELGKCVNDVLTKISKKK